jgi:hypothetical protein
MMNDFECLPVGTAARLKELEAERDNACELVAQMHHAATGYMQGPIRGVVEDIADLKTERDQLLAEVKRLRSQQAESMSGVKDSLTAQAEPVACHWHQDGDSESDMWAAGCGRHRYFTLNEGTPTENDKTHCCYCGKQLVEVPIEEGQ